MICLASRKIACEVVSQMQTKYVAYTELCRWPYRSIECWTALEFFLFLFTLLDHQQVCRVGTEATPADIQSRLANDI